MIIIIFVTSSNDPIFVDCRIVWHIVHLFGLEFEINPRYNSNRFHFNLDMNCYMNHFCWTVSCLDTGYWILEENETWTWNEWYRISFESSSVWVCCVLLIFVKFTLRSINIVYYIAANSEQRWIIFDGETFNKNVNERHLMRLSGNEDELIVVEHSQFSNILWGEKVQTKRNSNWKYLKLRHPTPRPT